MRSQNILMRRAGWVGVFLLLMAGTTGCKKLVTVNPPTTSQTNASIFNSDATAISAVSDMYTAQSLENNGGGSFFFSFYLGLSADEFTLYSGITNTSYIGYYTNALNDQNTAGNDAWVDIYHLIYVANSAIAGLNGSTGLTPAVKQQLMGESLFMRAFFYFYLVNLYGNVPLVLTPDYKVNGSLARTAQSQVWEQIITDLKAAQGMLSTGYLNGTLLSPATDRIRPTQWAATSMLARAYLYTGDWVDAEAQATSVINNTGLFGLSPLSGVFLKNSSEAIWQLQPVKVGQNTPDAWLFILPTAGPGTNYPVYLSNNLLSSFEPGDLRRTKWIDSVKANGFLYYYPYKYKSATLNAPLTEYEMALRLGEQYLIRAEARAEQNNLSGADSDLNVIRTRAGLPNTTATTQSGLLAAILHERQAELFTEWGNRWLDLKRTKTIDSVMNLVTPGKGGTWNTAWQLYPISLSELEADPNLQQTNGYAY